MMKKVLYKLNEKSFYILTAIVFISFLIINLNVVYFGDDYYFIQYRRYNVITHISKMINFYCNDNGRFIVHLLATSFLKIPMIFWKVLNSLMLTAICFFTSLLTTCNKEKKGLILCTAFLLISSIEITVTRQSVYWLTGSFNYVYPCVMLLAYAFTLTKIENKKYYCASLILGFLSAATMEQSAMMSFGLTILVFLSKFKDLKNIKQTIKDNKKILALLLVTFIGACTVLLAPAQFNRIKIETEKISIIDKMKDNIILLLGFYTRSYTILVYSIIFTIFSIIYICKNELKQNTKILYIISTCLNNFLIIINMFVINGPIIIKYFITLLVVITWVLDILYLNKKMYNQIISPITITAVLLLGSQIMMIVSPILGYRNMIFGLISYLFIIGIIVGKTEINVKIGYIFKVLLLILAFIYNYHTALGYYQTKNIENKNISIIQSNKEILSNSNSKLELYKYPNDLYSWSALYISKFHLEYFKKLYDIECEIEWK